MPKNIKLQTTVPLERAAFQIGPNDPVMLVGSCFTETMGKRMADLGFKVNVNPFGILYNPTSILTALDYCLNDKEIPKQWLVQHDGLWHSWQHHGSFSRTDRQECIDACNSSIHEAHRFLNDCRTLVITMGSAYCFSHSEPQSQDFIVGNCHKVPEKEFVRTLLSPEEIVSQWEKPLETLSARGIRVIFTVSPVRHQAYGLHGNQLGKATLLLALNHLLNSHNSPITIHQSRITGHRSLVTDHWSQVTGHEMSIHNSQFTIHNSYFPAYEIMMDELRDYRYYADDLLHPSPLAEEIIWQRFQQTYMTEETIAICDSREKENRRAAHRPLHSN